MYKFFLALRYLSARKITYFSVVGVALGVMALIVVMAVMEGFQRDFKGRIRGTLSDIIFKYRGREPIDEVLAKIESIPHVEAAAPRLRGMALLGSRGKSAVEIVGVDPLREGRVSELPTYVRKAMLKRISAHAILYFEELSLAVKEWTEREIARMSRGSGLTEAEKEMLGRKGEQSRAFADAATAICRKLATEGGVAQVRQAYADFNRAAAECGFFEKDKLEIIEAEVKVRLKMVDDEEIAAKQAMSEGGSALPFSSPSAREVILGEELASLHLRVLVGETVQMVTGSGKALPTAREKSPEGLFTVAGTFKSGMYKADSGAAYMPLLAAQEFTGRKGLVSEIGIKLDDFKNAASVQAGLRELFGEQDFRTWAEHRKTWLQAIHLEKAFLAVVLFMIVVVAGFVMLSTFLMLVTEKTRDLGIISALGGRPAGIVSIFLLACTFIGVIGSGAGTALGLAIAWNINEIEAAGRALGLPTPFPRNLYYLDEIPVVVQGWEIFWIVAPTVLVGVLLGGVLPAIRASLLDPLDALRYE